MKTSMVSGIAALLLAATASAAAAPQPAPAAAPAGATGQPAASVSLFTTHNRGLFRRGDPVDIFWCVRNGAEQPAADGTVTLAGRDLRVALGRIALPKREAGGSVSGYLKLDTATLAPGEYEVSVELAGAAGYPVRFRICQREPLSDYEIYSYVYGGAAPYCGSPVNAYYSSIPGGPGLDPIMKEVDASLDPAQAAKAADPAGPAPEKFARPTANEANLMALAALGMRAVLQYPTMLYHEDWNPKHTLPEDLAQMRRRLALFVQPLADVAGLGGITMGWYASQGGYWEDVPCQDGHQAKRNEAAIAWSKVQADAEVKKAAAKGVSDRDLEALKQRAGFRAGSAILANAWAAYLADVKQFAPHLSAHNAIPSWWMSAWNNDPAYAFRTLTHRDSVCYSDYGLTAWGNFRTPAWMNMGNRDGQKLLCNFWANQIHNRVATSFGATGRGLDGFSMPCNGDYPQGEDVALRKIFERFGSYFSALEPLPDVALYRSREEDGNALNVAMHDLARLRRPAMMVSYEDVLDGELSNYRVLFLASQKKPLASGISKAFKAFEARGGIIVKDRTCHASLPGRDLGFGYEGAQVHPVWGLAYANGEAEFAHLWKNFKETREKFLVETFAKIPGLPVTTADPDAVISPLAGKESICCFVMNQTLVPLSLEGKWRQYIILPKNNELLVENGWHVRNLLTGKPAAMEKTATGQKTAVDFTRADGAIFLLTRREPTKMAVRTERTAPATVRLTGWLADAADKPLVDPLPFEVTLRGPDGSVLFHKFAALSPDLALEVPVPARSEATPLKLEVRDLALGSTATVPLDPAPPATVSSPDTIDLVGGAGPIAAFLRERKGPVTVLLGEGQDAFRPAAEQLAALLKKAGRPSRVVQWNPAEVRPLTLRWKPTEQDTALIAGLAGGQGFAERIVPQGGKGFDDPNSGYDEYGPRLRHDADIVLFGTPATSLPVKQLAPYLRRVPSESYPAAGGFFVHYVWSPFQGGYDGLYVGCRDAAGATAAVAALENVKPPPRAAAAKGDAAPVVTAGGAPTPLEDMLTGKFGRSVQNIAFTPDGKRVFATSAGLGAQLFALSPGGQVQEARALHHRRGQLYQFVRTPLQALDDRTAEVGIMGTQYRFSLDKGFVSRWNPPAAGFFGSKAIGAAAAPVLDDLAHKRSYLGGKRRLHALDETGRCLWSYDDEAGLLSNQALLYPRNLYPRAVSGNGRVLLVAGFGSMETLYDARPVNTVVFGLDTASGKMLWEKDLFLNTGSVVPADAAFLVVDDKGVTQTIMAEDGAVSAVVRPIKGSALVRPVPGRSELLIIENDAFDRNGPTAKVVLRPTTDGADRELPVAGRVTDSLVMADGQSVLLATARGETLHLATADGRVLWRAATPSGGILRLAPDGKTVWVGACDGVIHRLDAATGQPLGATDLNPYNVTTPERFVQQMNAAPEVPVATDARTVPPPIEPSYRTTLDPKKVPLGKNLVPRLADPKARALAPDTSVKLTVEAGKTYLVELLAAAANPAKLTQQTRVEIAVTGARQTVNLPYVGRLPLTDRLARRRMAFRADEAGEVTLTLRAVEPGSAGEGKPPTYAQSQASPAGLLAGDVFVGTIDFRGPNLLLERGPTAKRPATGDLACSVQPWTGGSTLVRTAPYPCPQSALRMVNGRIAGEDTVWGPSVSGRDVHHARGVVRFKAPQTLTSIVVYEDNSGPVPAGDGVREKTAPRYSVYVQKAGARELTYVGHVVDNTQLVNVFAAPPEAVSEIHYFWAGRTDSDKIDGPVRMAEIEAYADEMDVMLDEVPDTENDDVPDPDL